MTTINDALDITKGFFSLIEEPLWEPLFDSDVFDIELFTLYGNRITAPLLDMFIDKHKGEPLTDSEVKYVVNHIYKRNKFKWEKQLEGFKVLYKIAENYDMVEREEMSQESFDLFVRELKSDSKNDSLRIDDLLNTFGGNNTSTTNRTGSDRISNSGTVKDRGNTTDTSKTTTSNSDSNTLRFDGRRDTEDRNLRNTNTGSGTEKGSNNSSLSFKDRKDTTSGSTTRDGSLNEHSTSKSNGTTKENTNTSNTSSTTNSGNSTTDNNIWGLNTTSSPAPEKQVKLKENGDTKDVGSEKTYNSGSTTNTINGSGGNKSHETGTSKDAMTKTGSELTTGGSKSETSSTGTGTEKGSVTNTKAGAEVTSGKSNGTTTNSGGVKSTNDSEIKDNSTTTYGSSDKNSGTNNGQSKNTGTVKDSGSSSQVDNENNKTNSESVTIRSLTRSGNIGVSTTSALIREHLMLWEDFDFTRIVLRDTANMLGLKIYFMEDDY